MCANSSHKQKNKYTAYLPYGELLVDEHSSKDMPYKFNGKAGRLFKNVQNIKVDNP